MFLKIVLKIVCYQYIKASCYFEDWAYGSILDKLKIYSIIIQKIMIAENTQVFVMLNLRKASDLRTKSINYF